MTDGVAGMSKLRVTLRVDFDSNNAIGPGKVALLEKMRDCGSLSQAARDLEMSYRRAWQLLDAMNHSFREPVVMTAVGGSGGGGSELTALGEAIIAAYRGLERETNLRASERFASILRTGTTNARVARRSVSRPRALARRTARAPTRRK